MRMRRTTIIYMLLISAFPCVLPGCQSEPKPCVTKSAVLTTPFQNLDYYVSCLRPGEKESFFASLRGKGFQKTIANLDVPMSFYYAQIRGGGRAVTPHGYLSWDEYSQYCQRISDVTRSLRSSAGATTGLAPAHHQSQSQPADSSGTSKK
jgi:hypothetical protein